MSKTVEDQTAAANMTVKDSEDARFTVPDGMTVDDFLGGKVKLIQPEAGYRVSMDTVMLAACVPAQSGERVIEGGIGSAGAALCLAKRIPGVYVHGVEIQSDMISAAQRNIRFNGLEGQVTVEDGTIVKPVGQAGRFDHAMINPPYLEHGHAIRPPVKNKGFAHMEHGTTLKNWVNFCLYHVRHKGTISIVYRADRLDELISRLYRRVGDLMIMPLWPRSGEAAKRVIIQGRKGTKGCTYLLPGFALHGEVERYTPEARRILWDGEALNLKAFAGQLQSR